MTKRTISMLLALSTLLGCQTAMTANSDEAARSAQGFTQSASEKVTWFDGQRQRSAWVSEREFAEFGQALSASEAGAELEKESRGVRLWLSRDDAPGRVRSLRAKAVRAKLSPVFYQYRDGGPRMALAGNILVRFKADWDIGRIEAWAADHQLKLLKPVLKSRNIYLIESEPGMASLELANEIHRSGEVVYATPNWWRETYLK